MIEKHASQPLRPLREREFALLTSFIRAECGIALSSAKKALVESRLKRRLQQLGLQTYYDYYLMLSRDEGPERQQMLNLVTTNETSFFREPAHFDLIERMLIPRWKRDYAAHKRPPSVRIWSAGCSTGEEPYSVAMALAWGFRDDPVWRFEVLASDISMRALEHAALGVYPIERAASIPGPYRERFVLRGRGERSGSVRIGDEIRSRVRFGRFNLHRKRYAMPEPFDLILCRNVLIYFGREERMAVVDRFLDLLADDGLLMLGHAESLQGESDRVRCVIPTVYALTANRAGRPAECAGGADA